MQPKQVVTSHPDQFGENHVPSQDKSAWSQTGAVRRLVWWWQLFEKWLVAAGDDHACQYCQSPKELLDGTVAGTVRAIRALDLI